MPVPATPTPLGLADLSTLTRGVAAQVRTGAHEAVLNPGQRWYRRLYTDPFVDVWLISWATEQATELHDHTGSLGALAMSYYAVGPGGGLRRTRSVLTDGGAA